MVWLPHAPTHSKHVPLALWAGDGTFRDTAACAGPEFRNPLRGRALAPRNTTRHILQGEHIATTGRCGAALCGDDCSSVRAATAVCLCLDAQAPCSWHTSRQGSAATSYQSPSPVHIKSLRNSSVVGLQVLVLKPVIGPSLQKLAIRIRATVPQLISIMIYGNALRIHCWCTYC